MTSKQLPNWKRFWMIPKPVVVLAASNSLLLPHDDAGYDVYYDVLTGERHARKGLIKGQLDSLKDKKKMAELGLEEGIGFMPLCGNRLRNLQDRDEG
jgi:hypothetical protein